MRKPLFAVLALASFAALLPACSGAEVGEACDTEGAEDECVDGAICGKPSDSAASPQCLVVCKDDNDCDATESCNGVTGSNVKACRIK